jgi:hypothetical protein
VVLFQLPIIPSDTSIGEAVAMLRDFGVWALIIRADDGFRLIDYRDLVAAPEPSQPLSAADFVPALDLNDLPDPPGSMNRARFREVMTEHGREFAVRESAEHTADVLAVSPELPTIYLSPAPGKRCTRPNRPDGTPNRAWYHYYPPLAPGAAGTCAEDGSPLI